MSNERASMQARLASINAVANPTPAQSRAAANISAALAKMDAYEAGKAARNKPARLMTIYDREVLMKLASDGQSARDRANRILDGGARLSEGDADFINRSGG